MSTLNIISNILGANISSSVQTTFTLTTNANTSTAQTINFLKTGVQSLSVDWGDGTTTTGLNHSHTYASAGQKSVVIACDDISTITSLVSDSGHWNYDISVVPSNLVTFDVRGSNAIFGNVSDAPKLLTFIRVQGSNVLTGNISNFTNTIVTFNVTGVNTISGNVSDAPASIVTFVLTGANTVQYDSLFNDIFATFLVLPAVGGAWTSTQVDNFLAALNASITANSRTGTANIAGNNAARTSASDADVTAIQSAGWTLTVNE